MNNARKLPDAYNKTVGSNLYNLLQLLNLLDIDLKSDLKNILQSRNIENATGATLDAYGEMVGVKRNCASDENYRTRIIARISTLTVDSDINSVLSAIARTFGIDVSDIKISDGVASVTVQGMTIDLVNTTSCKCSEVDEILRSFIPVGVTLEPVVYAGTLLVNNSRILGSSELATKYPILYPAWSFSMDEYEYRGRDVGLSGHGEVPSIFGTTTSGDFAGGTLSMRSDDK